MSAADLKRTESFQYPAAHYGHLNEAQQHALDEFKRICQDEGYYRPPGAGARSPASHDDETLLYVYFSRWSGRVRIQCLS